MRQAERIKKMDGITFEQETESTFPRGMIMITTNRHQSAEEWEKLAGWIAFALKAFDQGKSPWYKANVVYGYKVVVSDEITVNKAALKLIDGLGEV